LEKRRGTSASLYLKMEPGLRRAVGGGRWAAKSDAVIHRYISNPS
jgi:hypothetical protein